VSSRNLPKVTGFDRVVLLWGSALDPSQYLDSAWIASLVTRPTGKQAFVAECLDRLELLGLVTTRRRRSRVLFKRTARGRAAAERILRDRRVSHSLFRALEDAGKD
jgi:hypothetical protein